jgi:hypothetical protein
MSKSLLKLFSVLLLGVAIGSFLSWLHYRSIIAKSHEFVAQHVLDDIAGKISNELDALVLVRTGEYERLIRERETSLNSYIMSLSWFEPAVWQSEKQAKSLQNAFRYYQNYSVTTEDTNMDVEIKSFLETVERKRNADER